MHTAIRNTSSLVLGALLAVTATPAFADEAHIGSDHNQIDGVRMEVHASVGNYGVFGVGLRGDIPILANGIIEGVNDELAISVGAEVFFVDVYQHEYAGGPYVMPLAMLQWNFYLGDDWSVFPEAGVAMYVGDGRYLPRGRGFYAGVGTGIGARYHFSPRNSLVLRAGWPAGLQAGLTF